MRSNTTAQKDKRDESIVATYVNDTQVTIQYIRQKYGLSNTHIRGILKKAGVEIRPEPKGRPSLLNLKPISRGHVWLGSQLDMHITKTKGCSLTQLAYELEMSPHDLGLARFGAYDFRLSELQQISKIIDLGLKSELMMGVMTYKEIG